MLSSLCKAAGNTLRLQILRVLADDSFSASELCHICSQRPATLSHHLNLLSSAGLIVARRDGNSLFYQRSPQSSSSGYQPLQDSLFSILDSQEMDEQLKSQIRSVLRDRNRRCEEFFKTRGAELRQRQDMIAEARHYMPVMSALIDNHPLPHQQATIALEVGCGDGAFLPVLSERFTRVIALDQSAEMLTQTRQLVERQQLEGVSFIHGDTSHPALSGLQANIIVINMALHHSPSPALVFQDCARALESGGKLYISELCDHQQEWARTVCGDRWLGFMPAELNLWAEKAGFSSADCQIIGLRNGFRIQIRHFILNDKVN